MLRVAHLSNEKFGGAVVALAYGEMRGAQLLNLKLSRSFPEFLGFRTREGRRPIRSDSVRRV